MLILHLCYCNQFGINEFLSTTVCYDFYDATIFFQRNRRNFDQERDGDRQGDEEEDMMFIRGGSPQRHEDEKWDQRGMINKGSNIFLNS